jgi:hypothetical protein
VKTEGRNNSTQNTVNKSNKIWDADSYNQFPNVLAWWKILISNKYQNLVKEGKDDHYLWLLLFSAFLW